MVLADNIPFTFMWFKQRSLRLYKFFYRWKAAAVLQKVAEAWLRPIRFLRGLRGTFAVCYLREPRLELHKWERGISLSSRTWYDNTRSVYILLTGIFKKFVQRVVELQCRNCSSTMRTEQHYHHDYSGSPLFLRPEIPFHVSHPASAKFITAGELSRGGVDSSERTAERMNWFK